MDGYASHLEALVWALSITTGPVLELGAGWYSTPLLSGSGREVVTVEQDPKWRARLASWESARHCISSTAPQRDWAVVLVDCGLDRASSIERFRNADLLVVHDTEPEVVHVYPGMHDALETFEHRRDFTRLVPWTTVVSDRRQLSES